MNNINNLSEYIQKTSVYVYNNINFKQILLILLVFFSIYLVEHINSLNIHFGLIPAPPGSIQLANQMKIPTKKKSTKNKSKSVKIKK